MFVSIKEVAQGLSASGYIADPVTVTTVYLAGALHRPLLLEGPAGSGKTQLAYAVAEAAHTRVERLQCYEGINEDKAIGQFDESRQRLFVQYQAQSQAISWDELSFVLMARLGLLRSSRNLIKVSLLMLSLVPWQEGYGGSNDTCTDLPGGTGSPSIAFTFVPVINTASNLTGQVLHVSSAGNAVVVYIHIPASFGAGSGWWVKPFAGAPLTTIKCDGTWSTNIVTGGVDEAADEIVAFVIPSTFSPPILQGSTSLPSSLAQNALAQVMTSR